MIRTATKARIAAFFGRNWQRMVDLVFFDQARLVEWLSMAILFGFAFEMMTHPELLEREVYQPFTAWGAGVWATLLFAGSALQLVSILRRHHELRFVALIVGFAFFGTLTIVFGSSGLSTTATRTYGSLCVACLIAGVFVLWTSNPSKR
jgi:hypothetical protein